MKCRHCNTELSLQLIDLGSAPPSNAYMSADDLRKPETWYPLRVMVCRECRLVQTEDYAHASELFRPDYAYFSSMSASWLEHARQYSENIIKRLNLNSSSFVIEVASNDGYLLKNFLAAKIPCLGIEPTSGTADAAGKLGIPVMREFFGEKLGRRLADEDRQADLIIGNNVYAHVPDINDFTKGLKAVLKPGGVITLEFPHLLQLLQHTQFDTIYHEHFSYLSLHTVRRIFESCGLRIYDVDELSTHGGSLRVYGCHAADGREEAGSVSNVLEAERNFGLLEDAAYSGFQECANRIKNELMNFLIDQKTAGKQVAAYGAAAKGNTLLNYAGVRPDLLPYVCDAAPSKQGRYLPGSRIPILPPDEIKVSRPDYVLILPWNIAEEIQDQLACIRDWGGRFVTALPKMRVI